MGGTITDSGAALRLTPEMASRRLLVLAFVREYIARWHASPSYGEIACALGISRSRARDLVKALVRSGHLVRSPGPRGLSMPTRLDAAVRQLRSAGWHIDESSGVCTHPPLPAMPVLDYNPGGSVEHGNGKTVGAAGGQGPGGSRAA